MIDSLGGRLRWARKAAGLAQDDIAIEAGVRRLAVASWEHDESVPRADQLVSVAKKAGVDPGWLLTGKGRVPKGFADSMAAEV